MSGQRSPCGAGDRLVADPGPMTRIPEQMPFGMSKHGIFKHGKPKARRFELPSPARGRVAHRRELSLPALVERREMVAGVGRAVAVNHEPGVPAIRIAFACACRQAVPSPPVGCQRYVRQL
jgi:hypothetical protein